jgi:hypothetical protein
LAALFTFVAPSADRIEVKDPSEKNWISNLYPAGASASATDLTIKDLVELLLNLFQVSTSRNHCIYSI